MDTPNLAQAQWRKSSYSGTNGGSCVEVAAMDDDTIAVRNSNHPDAGTVYFTPTEIDAFLKGVKAGEFDDLHL